MTDGPPPAEFAAGRPTPSGGVYHWHVLVGSCLDPYPYPASAAQRWVTVSLFVTDGEFGPAVYSRRQLRRVA